MCGWEALREERIYTGRGGGTRIIGIQFQDQKVMTPLLGRASGEGLRDCLPTPDSHQLSSRCMHTNTHVHIILRYLRRVNHFLRPSAEGPGLGQDSPQAFKPHLCLFISVYLYLSFFLFVSSCPSVSLLFNLRAPTPFSVFNTMSSLSRVLSSQKNPETSAKR